MQERKLAKEKACQEMDKIKWEGKIYLAGSAGSLIIACDKCGEEHFRYASNYFFNPNIHNCMTCKPKHKMQPILIEDMETKWFPFWLSLGWKIKEEFMPE